MSTHESALSPGKGCLRPFKLYSSSTLYFQRHPKWFERVLSYSLRSYYATHFSRMSQEVQTFFEEPSIGFMKMHKIDLNFTEHGCLLTLLLHVFLGLQTLFGSDRVHNCVINAVVKNQSNRRIICRDMTKVSCRASFFLGHPVYYAVFDSQRNTSRKCWGQKKEKQAQD